MSLPLKLLPAAYAAWRVLEPSRPFEVVPVTVEEYSPPGINPKVVSSVKGKIDTLVLYYPGFQEAREKRRFAFTEFMIELVGVMEGRGRTFVLVIEEGYKLPMGAQGEDLEQLLKSRAEKAGHQLEIIYIKYENKTISPWVQDAFLAIQYQLPNGEYQTYLVESMMNKVTYSGQALAEASSKQARSNIKGLQYQPSNLPFVGGNVLAGEDFVLIGLHDSCKTALKHQGEQWIGEYILLSSVLPDFLAEWTNAITTKDGVANYLNSKSDDQIIYHIDLFITLAGKGVRRNKTEFIVVGEPCIGFEGLEQADEDVQKLVHKIIQETSKSIDTIVEQIKEGMERLSKRYQIVRCPLNLTYFDSMDKVDGVMSRTRYFCWATYNNCIIEQYIEEDIPINRVFLPSYGGLNSDYSAYPKDRNPKYGTWRQFKKHDEKIKEFWENKLGYEVVLLETDYNPFVKYQGALNCLTNCISRK